MKVNSKTLAVTCTIVFVFLLGFSLSVQAYALRQQELNSSASRFLRENFGVNSIEEYVTKLEQELWLNYSTQEQSLASEYPDLATELNRLGELRQFGTSTYQPPPINFQPVSWLAVGEPSVMIGVFSLSGLGLVSMVAVPFVRKRKRLMQALTLSVVVLCVFSIGYFAGTISAQSGTITIEPYSFQETASYVVFADGTTVYAKNGATGQIDLYSTNDDDVIQYCINQTTTNGGSVFVKAGSYSASVTLKDKVRLIIEKGATGITVSVDSGATCWLEDYNGATKYFYSGGTLVWKENLSTGEFWWNGQNCTDTLLHPEQIASYFIFTDGTTVYAKNGTTGQIDFSGTDAKIVIESAINALPDVISPGAGTRRTGKGGLIVFGPGVFKAYSKITIPVGSMIFLKGAGGGVYDAVGMPGTTWQSGTVIYGQMADTLLYVPKNADGYPQTCLWLEDIQFRVKNPTEVLNKYALSLSGCFLLYMNRVTLGSDISSFEATKNFMVGLYHHPGLLHTYTYLNNVDVSGFRKYGIDIHAPHLCMYRVQSRYNNGESDSAGLRIVMYQNSFIHDINVQYSNYGIIVDDYSTEPMVIEEAFFEYLPIAPVLNLSSYPLYIGTAIIDTNNTHWTGHITNPAKVKIGTLIYRYDPTKKIRNSGTATVANGEWISHSLIQTPTIVTLTSRNATAGTPAVPIIVSCVARNSTMFQVGVYWANGTAYTIDNIVIDWYAEI